MLEEVEEEALEGLPRPVEEGEEVPHHHREAEGAEGPHRHHHPREEEVEAAPVDRPAEEGEEVPHHRQEAEEAEGEDPLIRPEIRWIPP